jgi:hypothetical protein
MRPIFSDRDVRILATFAIPAVFVLPSVARAQDAPPTSGTTTQAETSAAAVGELASTQRPDLTPTLLFTPAVAVAPWNARVVGSVSALGPTMPDRLASGTVLGFHPGLGGEIGLPAGFTFAAGTTWVGGDPSPTPVDQGLSPYAQARYQILGDLREEGFKLGSSLTYKFVGFQGDPGEMELALSTQYRRERFEIGVQGVAGKDLATTSADAEVRAYAVYRIVPSLSVGAASQVRIAVVSQPDDSAYDVIGGGIGSLRLGVWQLGALAGVNMVGLAPGQVGSMGQLFGAVVF